MNDPLVQGGERKDTGREGKTSKMGKCSGGETGARLPAGELRIATGGNEHIFQGKSQNVLKST